MRALLLGILAFGLTACASSPSRERGIQVTGPAIVRNTPAAGTDVEVAAYVRLFNPKRAADRLVRVTCACAREVQIHATPADAAMHALPHLDIPAGGALAIAPGGSTHLMLMGVTAPIAPGDRVRMTLHFANTGPVSAEFEAVENSRDGWAARLAP